MGDMGLLGGLDKFRTDFKLLSFSDMDSGEDGRAEREFGDEGDVTTRSGDDGVEDETDADWALPFCTGGVGGAIPILDCNGADAGG
jgi:hypothetical protein